MHGRIERSVGELPRGAQPLDERERVGRDDDRQPVGRVEAGQLAVGQESAPSPLEVVEAPVGEVEQVLAVHVVPVDHDEEVQARAQGTASAPHPRSVGPRGDAAGVPAGHQWTKSERSHTRSARYRCTTPM